MAIVSALAASIQADAVAAMLDGGYLDIYGGDQPDTPEIPADRRTLATLRFGSTAFAEAVEGLAMSGPLSADRDAAGGGRATWARGYAADHRTVVVDLKVGLQGEDADLIIETSSGSRLIEPHATVSCRELALLALQR